MIIINHRFVPTSDRILQRDVEGGDGSHYGSGCEATAEETTSETRKQLAPARITANGDQSVEQRVAASEAEARRNIG